MNIEQGKISNLQIMFLIIATIQGSGLLFSFIDNITKHDTWLVLISAYVVVLPLFMSYVFLIQKFPGNNIIQINDIIYGSYLGKFISSLYALLYLILLSLNIRDLSDFYEIFIMPETPLIFFVIFITVIGAYAVIHGLEGMARTSFFMILVSLFILLITIILLAKDMRFSNFLPIFEIPFKSYIQGINLFITIPFTDILVYLMVMSNVNNIKSMHGYSLMGLTISALLLLVFALRNIAIIGNELSITVSPSYQATRLIDIGSFLTRMEVLTSIGFTTALFMKIWLMYYAAVTSVSQLFRLRSYKTLILPIGGIALCMAIIMFDSTVDHNFNATYYHPILVLPIFLLPPFSLLMAKIRKLPKQMGGE